MQKTDKLLHTSPGNTEYNMLKAGAWRGLAKAHSQNEKHRTRADAEYSRYLELSKKLLQKSPENPRLKIMYADALTERAACDISQQNNKEAGERLQQAIVLLTDIAEHDRNNATVQQMLKTAQDLLSSLSPNTDKE
jgi:predicted Zn-dependent protease